MTSSVSNQGGGAAAISEGSSNSTQGFRVITKWMLPHCPKARSLLLRLLRASGGSANSNITVRIDAAGSGIRICTKQFPSTMNIGELVKMVGEVGGRSFVLYPEQGGENAIPASTCLSDLGNPIDGINLVAAKFTKKQITETIPLPLNQGGTEGAKVTFHYKQGEVEYNPVFTVDAEALSKWLDKRSFLAESDCLEWFKDPAPLLTLVNREQGKMPDQIGAMRFTARISEVNESGVIVSLVTFMFNNGNNLIGLGFESYQSEVKLVEGAENSFKRSTVTVPGNVNGTPCFYKFRLEEELRSRFNAREKDYYRVISTPKVIGEDGKEIGALSSLFTIKVVNGYDPALTIVVARPGDKMICDIC